MILELDAAHAFDKQKKDFAWPVSWKIKMILHKQIPPTFIKQAWLETIKSPPSKRVILRCEAYAMAPLPSANHIY